MTEPDRINAILDREAPLVARMLSPLGRRVALPKGILFQAAQAAGSTWNATLGQVTDGRGAPLPLPQMEEALHDLDPRMAFLYSPQQGHLALRQAWAARQRALSGGSAAPTSLPIVTHGLTQSLALVADLFADPDTEVVIPAPYWGNYNLIFGLRHGARMRPFPFFDDGRFNVDGLERTLSEVKGKAIVVLNIPGNPTGYTPPAERVARLVEVLTAHRGPMVVVLDDAYAGMAWEDGLMARSLFWDLLEAADPERLFPIKVDGSTKELLFFPGRVGFLTHGLTGEAEGAMLSKLQGLGRATVGSPPGPSQAMVLRALRSPDLEASIAERFAVLGQRYRRLKEVLAAAGSSALSPWPFNSGCFALIGLDRRHDADAVRLRLLHEHAVGVLSMADVNALRLAYCGTAADDLEIIVDRIQQVLASE